MNYYNPYFMVNPAVTAGRGSSLGFFARNGITLSSILNGTQRTLGIINQAIPIVKQAAPMFQNAKTMFKVMNEFKKVDTPVTNEVTTKEENLKKEATTIEPQTQNYDGPTFFL